MTSLRDRLEKWADEPVGWHKRDRTAKELLDLLWPVIEAAEGAKPHVYRGDMRTALAMEKIDEALAALEKELGDG